MLSEYDQTVERETFDLRLDEFYRRRPFQPFRIYFQDGGILNVDHPESLLLRKGISRAAHMDRAGAMTFFDATNVTRFQEAVDEPERVG
jgi:hypothetical protein